MENIPSINTKQLSEVIRLSIALDNPLHIWGSPGLGKTDVVRQVANHLKGCFVDCRLSQYESVDLRGLPDTEGNQTVWRVPSTLPFRGTHFDTGEQDKPIILFLDEAMQASSSVQAVAFQLVLDRRIGEHELLPNVRIVAASNRETDRAGTQRMLTPLANRFTHVELIPNLDAWVDWAREAKLPEALVAWVRFRPDALDSFDEANKNNIKAYVTPRSVASVGKILNLFLDKEDKFVGLERARPLIDGSIGTGYGAELIAFIQVWESMPQMSDIHANPTSAPIPTEASMQFAVIAALAACVTDKTLPATLTYGKRLNKEYLVSMVVDIIKRHPSMAAHPATIQFYADHKDLLLGRG